MAVVFTVILFKRLFEVFRGVFPFVMTDLIQLRKIVQLMTRANPGDHINTLGLRFTKLEAQRICAELPYSDAIVGNPETGVIHGGALTALLDSACGVAAVAAIDELSMSPTMDLRIDHMGEAEPGKSVFAEAEAYRVTRHVIFCRGRAYQDDPERPVARCVANFIRLDPDILASMQEQLAPILEAME